MFTGPRPRGTHRIHGSIYVYSKWDRHGLASSFVCGSALLVGASCHEGSVEASCGVRRLGSGIWHDVDDGRDARLAGQREVNADMNTCVHVLCSILCSEMCTGSAVNTC